MYAKTYQHMVTLQFIHFLFNFRYDRNSFTFKQALGVFILLLLVWDI